MAHVSPGRRSSGSDNVNVYGEAEAYELFEVENGEDDAQKPEARALLEDVESKTSLEDQVPSTGPSEVDEFLMDEMVARVSVSKTCTSRRCH